MSVFILHPLPTRSQRITSEMTDFILKPIKIVLNFKKATDLSLFYYIVVFQSFTSSPMFSVRFRSEQKKQQKKVTEQ